MAGKPRRGQNTPEKMRELLELRQERGWTFQQLSNYSGISVSTLNYWKSRIRKMKGRENSTSVAQPLSTESFVAVDVQPIQSGDRGSFEVVLPSGHRVFVPDRFDPESLAILLNTLRSSC